MTIIRSSVRCKGRPRRIVFGSLIRGPRTVGQPLSGALWPTFIPLRVLETNLCHLLLEEMTSPLVESQQRWLLDLQDTRERRMCQGWRGLPPGLDHKGGPWGPAGPASASCEPLARLLSSCTAQIPGRSCLQGSMSHLLAFSLPRLHPGGCGVLPSLICTEVGGGR